MKKHGVFYCTYCGYDCPVKAPVNQNQEDAFNILFWDIVWVKPS